MTDLRSAAVPGLREDDHVRESGGPDSPLVILYADFTCPRCALAWARLKDAPLRVCFRHFALKAKDPRAPALANAAEAAGRQGAFWRLLDALYADQGRQDDPYLWEHCATFGLDLERFEDDRRAQSTADRVARDVRDGIRAGVLVTPTLFRYGSDGPEPAHPGPPDPSLVREWTQSDQ